MQVFKPNIFLIFLVTVDPGFSRDNENIISEVTSQQHDHHVPVHQGLNNNTDSKILYIIVRMI